jgi:hypothetical protein
MGKVVLCILFGICTAFSGFERTAVGARSASLGNAYTGLADDVWAIYFNPAGLSQLDSWEISFYHSPQTFGLQELSLSAAAAALPISLGTVGIAARRYGYELYREVSGTASFARTLSPNVHIGVSLNYHTVAIRNYGSAGTIGLDVGVLVRLLERVRWGTMITNLNSPTIGEASEGLPQRFSTGIAYTPADVLSLVFDLQKESPFDVNSRFGFEYRIVDAVAVRGGVSDTPSQFAGGFGIRFSFLQLDYGFTTHQELGWSHHASISIR